MPYCRIRCTFTEMRAYCLYLAGKRCNFAWKAICTSNFPTECWKNIVVYRSEDALMPSSGGHPKRCLIDRQQVKGRLARPSPTFVSRGRDEARAAGARLTVMAGRLTNCYIVHRCVCPYGVIQDTANMYMLLWIYIQYRCVPCLQVFPVVISPFLIKWRVPPFWHRTVFTFLQQ